MQLISRGQVIEKSEDDILNDFTHSQIYTDTTRDEDVRLALFITFIEPFGLNSAFNFDEFPDLWEHYTKYKYRYLSGN